jgi:hypothetical protein
MTTTTLVLATVLIVENLVIIAADFRKFCAKFDTTQGV